MAAEFEEVAGTAHARDAEHLDEDGRDEPLGGGRRIARVALRRIGDGRCLMDGRQRRAVELAVRRERQAVEQQHGGRHHVRGQALVQMRAQGARQVVGLAERYVEETQQVGVGGKRGRARRKRVRSTGCTGCIGYAPRRRAGHPGRGVERRDERVERAICATVRPAQPASRTGRRRRYVDGGRIDRRVRRRRCEAVGQCRAVVGGIEPRDERVRVREPGVRNPPDDDAGIGAQRVVAQHAEVRRGGRVDVARRGSRHGASRRRAARLRDDRVIAIRRELVATREVLQPHVDVGDVAAPRRERVEQGRIEQQLGFLRDEPIQLRAQRRALARAVAPAQQLRRLELPQQRQAAQVADDQPAARREMVERALDHAQRIGGIGKVLRDRVDDDRVEIVREAVERVGGAFDQRHRAQPAPLDDAAEPRDRLRGEIEPDEALARRGERQQQHAAAAADLEHAARRPLADPRERFVAPHPHLVTRDRFAVVAVGPADDVEQLVVGRVAAVDHVEAVAPAGRGAGSGLRCIGAAIATARHRVRDELRGVARARHDDRAVGDGRMRAQRRVDVAELDPEAAQLDLLIGAAAIFEPAVRVDAPEIAAAIEAGAGRIDDETLGRQRIAAEIAARHACAADENLADHAGRHGLQMRVDEADRHVGQRLADQAAVAAARVGERDAPIGDVHGRLGDAVHVDEGRRVVAVAVDPAAQARQFERLAAEDHVAQRKLRLAAVALLFGDQLAERRRCLVQHGHARVAQQVVERVGRAAHGLRHDDEFAAVRERAPDFPYREVERGRMEQRPHVGLVEAEQRFRRREQPREIAGRHAHAFRAARRARREDHVRERVGVGRGQWRRRCDRRRVVVDRPDRRARVRGGGQRGLERALGEHDGRLRVLEHRQHACFRIAGVERDVRGARAQHGKHRDDRVEAGPEPQAHARACAEAGVDEPMRERVGARIERAVAERRVAAAQRDRVGPRPRVLAHALANRREARGGRCGVRRCGIDCRDCAREPARQREPRKRQVRLAPRVFEQRDVLRGEPLDRRALEQVRVERQREREAVAVAREEQFEIEARRLLRDDRLDRQAAEREGRVGPLVEHRDGDLEQRIAARLARHAQVVDQLVVRQRRVAHRIADHGRLPARQLAQARVAGQVAAQHDHVREEADHRLRLDPLAPGHRRADHDVVLSRMSRDQRHEARDEHGERRRALVAREAVECRHDGAGDRARQQAIGVRRVSPPHAAHAVERQLERRRAGELRAPVRALARPVLAARALPCREIAIRDAERRQRVRAARAPRVVQRDQLAQQDAHRRGVAEQVIEMHQHRVLVRGQPHDTQAERAARREIERRREQRARGLDERRVLRGAGAAGPVLDRDVGVAGRAHVLPGHAVAHADRGAQRVVATHERVDAFDEQRLVERAAQPERAADRVAVAAFVQFVQEPQALLRERQRRVRAGRPARNRAVGGARGDVVARQRFQQREIEIEIEIKTVIVNHVRSVGSASGSAG
ncbi:hypothetical protein BST28156_06724 [Burkholderia stagnalis]|nr:hypothetical protein BST28156_06724 [Burkholderia stagnalis]